MEMKRELIDGKRHITYGDFEMVIEKQTSGYAHCMYTVRRIRGEWPSRDDLITLCDGDHPDNPRHFGGSVPVVSETENTRRVKVYED